jgi:hypothetical protein
LEGAEGSEVTCWAAKFNFHCASDTVDFLVDEVGESIVNEIFELIARKPEGGENCARFVDIGAEIASVWTGRQNDDSFRVEEICWTP